MKYIALIIFLVLILNKSEAQRLNTDSLWKVVENTKNDSLRMQSITALHLYYIGIEIDSNFQYSTRLIKTCNKLNNPRYKALSIIYSSFVYYRLGDFKTVQEHIRTSTALAEKNNDDEVLARIENFRHLIESDPLKKVDHLRKAIIYKKALINADPLSIIMLGNLASAFLSINAVDSSFYYAQKMYELAIKANETLSSYVTSVMGNVYLKMKQPEIAFAFYKRGLDAALKSPKMGDHVRAYAAMARYYEEIGLIDSVLYYKKKPFEYGPKELFTTKLFASKFIYEYYLTKGQNDSATKYMKFYIYANDSINSTTKIVQLQAAKFDEDLQQRELDKIKETEKEQRNHNIQLAITAIVILTAVILFLLLSRSILVSHKVVEFLSVIVLLVVFEFINLLIHPFLEKITHHSPVLMLLALVAIAALIVPLHHRLEHWTTKILVEKNKAIRLAKAKQTIQELEADSPNS